jgi:glycerol dehydrogenase
MKDKRLSRNSIAAFPGKYIQGENALADLAYYMELFGSNGLILASPTVHKKILPEYGLNENERGTSIETFQGECCEKELNRLSEIVFSRHSDILVGMGGGKTIDTAKIVADRAGIPMIIVPTIASTDAPCSGCAVIYSESGVFESVYYLRMNPEIVLLDTKVIANAPVRFLVAGMGDALATWFEARSCSLTNSPNECGGYSTLTALHLAKLCYETLLQYGSEARSACEEHIVSPALEHIVEANTLLSGIGFESSGLAAAHSVHNGLSMLPETHMFLHGEKVAFGTLTGLHLNNAPPGEMDEVYSFYEAVGLPTTFRDIGITDISRSRLTDVAVKSCIPAEGIHHEPVDINPFKVIDAMIAADTMGRLRKSNT